MDREMYASTYANGQREAERVIQISIETEFVPMELFIGYLKKVMDPIIQNQVAKVN